MQGVKVIPGLHAVPREVLPQQVPPLPALRLHAEDPGRVVPPLLDAVEAGHAREALAVPRGELAAVGHDLGQHLDLGADERSPEAVHLCVRCGLEVQEVVRRVEPVVDEGLEVVVVLLLARVDPAAIAGCDGLVGVEGCDRKVPEGADQLTVVSLRAHSLTDVLDEPPAPCLAELSDLLDVAAGRAVGVANDHSLHKRCCLL
mmetsp:Transcript_108771/g.318221  ORF Transcript_108771/g.318221 Transcript_108771/m.318221 type:complete len:202 (+) Transcript_108771:364-969(+)